ncbi:MULTISPECIES: hypothetical protein [Eisenbergiella]|uniref:Glycoside hydrolase family 2 domain-containing protein n=1 Tax=Eisenbergiella porci TaxID=2652274 RepID=A0A6N7WQY1_9FIRM|nr:MULTISPECIES: hypothetical protein [Eisenbergiella]MDY2653772.1 hypothetical protein [Eisenbergiella porci]MSS91868.1 hypothetical protein [Eisenbergiella porci]
MADGQDIGQIEAEIIDAEGNLCPQAESELTFITEGTASVIGVDNGNPESHESMRANHIHALGGRAYAVVRSDGTAGECIVRICSEKLGESCVTLCFD